MQHQAKIASLMLVIGTTPLNYAAAEEIETVVIDALLQSGIAEARSYEKRALRAHFLMAAHTGDLSVLKHASSEELAIFDDREWSLLMVAISNFQIEFATYLIKSGADLRYTSKDGWNAIRIASAKDLPSVLESISNYVVINHAERSVAQRIAEEANSVKVLNWLRQ